MQDDFDEKPCISLSVREVQPATKSTEAKVEEENEARPFDPAPRSAMEGWSNHSWPLTPRAEPATFFGGPLAEESPNLC